MKAITLTRPWSALVARRRKRIETRSWGTAYRGPLAIHAGKGPGEYTFDDLRDLVTEQAFADALRMPDGRDARLEELAAGAMVAVCRLADCRLMMDSTGKPGFRVDRHFDIGPNGSLTEEERAFGYYIPGRYAWILEEIVAIKPVEVRGAQGLWDAPAWFNDAWKNGTLELEEAA